MLAAQMCAPNSPQWFNTGLHWAYGIDGPSQGHYYVDFKTKKLVKSQSSYEHPQPHACFIQSVADDLVNHLSPLGAAVILEASHGCMKCRGVMKQNSTMVTSSMKGVFFDNNEARNELMQLIKE